jgi:hypothetical protein
VSDLSKSLFERDLSPKEFQSLMREVEASPQAALELAQVASRAYAATAGLAGLGLLKAALLSGAALALGGGLAWMALKPASPAQAESALLLPPPPLARMTPQPALAPRMDMGLVPGDEGRSNLRLTLSAQRPEEVSLALEDSENRVLKVLYRGPLKAGRRDFEWDLRDARGALVGPGNYFVRLSYAQGHELRALQVDLRIEP